MDFKVGFTVYVGVVMLIFSLRADNPDKFIIYTLIAALALAVSAMLALD